MAGRAGVTAAETGVCSFLSLFELREGAFRALRLPNLGPGCVVAGRDGKRALKGGVGDGEGEGDPAIGTSRAAAKERAVYE
jgi:hypothetical protein